MPNSQSVDIVDPEALRAFDLLTSQTDLSTIRTYLRWSLLSSTPSTVLPSSLEEEDFAFNGRFLHGQPEQQPRSLSCTILVEGALEDFLAKLYVEKVMSAEDRHRAAEIVQNIEAAMDKDIEDLAWMSSQTKIEAKRKLHLIVNNVGFPPVWRDYSEVAVRRDDALGNVLRGLRYREKLSFSAVGKPIDRTRGVLGPLVSGASYSPEQNEVETPASEIQPPNFVRDASDAENYARLGFVVGHEVTHAFDDEGRHYDGLGALRNWWTSDDSIHFSDRAACFVKKYGAISLSGGQYINENLTLGENLADNGGLRLAYMAFLADAREKGIDLERVQRGHTPRQEFFLSFAQYWCETIRPKQELRQIQNNPHTPDRLRGIEVLKNLPDFGDAFACKAGKPMTPEDHCRV